MKEGKEKGGKRERELEIELVIFYFICLWYFLHPCSFTITNIHHRGLPSFCNLHVCIILLL